jgi:hypothetical protein
MFENHVFIVLLIDVGTFMQNNFRLRLSSFFLNRQCKRPCWSGVVSVANTSKQFMVLSKRTLLGYSL